MNGEKYKLKLEVEGYDIIPFCGGFILCLLVPLFLLHSAPWTVETAICIILDVFVFCFLLFCYSVQIKEAKNE